MKVALTVFFFFISTTFTNVSAQVFLSYDLGVSKIAYKNQYLSKNYYTGYSPSVVNTDLFYRGKESYLRFNFNYQNYESLNPVIEEINYFDNYFNLESYQIIIEYLIRTETFSNGVNIYLGYQLRGLFSEIEQNFESEFINSRINFSESVYADLSLIGRLEYQFREIGINYSAGVGLVRYFEETDPRYFNESNFYGLGFNYYRSFQSSLELYFWINDKVALKPAYLIRFDRTDYKEETKRLNQSVLIGGILKLW